jgi:EmrB/QacA subfamily drug resistance transporter
VSRRERIVLAISSAGFCVVQLDLFIVNIAFPSIQRGLPGTSLSALSWVLGGYAIAYAAFLVAGGRLADRVGRRRIFLAGLTLFTFASAVCAVAPSAAVLIGARVVQAIGAALVTPASLGLLLAEFSPERRTTAIAAWVAVGGAAAASGPALGGALVGGSWRLIFLVNLPVGIAISLFAVRALTESLDNSADGWPDLLGALLLSLGIAGLVLVLTQGATWHWLSRPVLVCLLVSLVLLASFVVRSRSHPRPVVELGLLRVRSFAFAGVATVFYMTAFSASLLATVLYLTTVWHQSPLLTGLEITPGPLLVTLLSVPVGRLAGRVGQRYLIAIGCGVFALGCGWWLWRMAPNRSYAEAFLPGWLLCGVGVGLALSSMMSAGAGSLPANRFATGTAVLTMCRQVGAAVGVAALVALLGHPRSAESTAAFDRAWLFMVAAALGAAAAGLAVGTVGPPSVAAEREGVGDPCRPPIAA